MTRKRWTDKENQLLQNLVKEGTSIEQIVQSNQLPNRTHEAIRMQILRLKTTTPVQQQKKNHPVQQISEAQIIGYDTIVKRYIDAFNKICDTTEYKKEDLERFRIIFMAAWKYRDLFREYEKIEEVKTRVEKLEKLVEQLLSEKKAEALKQAA